MEARTPPQNLEAEQVVLGSILLDPEAMDSVRDVLHPEDFYAEKHRIIFRALHGLHDKAEPIDLVTVTEELRQMKKLEAVGSVPYLIGLADNTPTAAYVGRYAEIVREKSTLRDLVAAAGSILQTAYDQALPLEEILDKAEQGVYRLATSRSGERFASQSDLAARLSTHLQELEAGALDGLSTGFVDLDELISGFQPGSLNILAARPSMGKTALSLSLAYNAAKAGHAGAFFSLEMSDLQLEQRLLAMEGRLDMRRVRNGQMSSRDWERAAHTLSHLSGLGIFVDDSSQLSISEFRSRARRLAARERIEWIVVDYLQLMSAPGGNREQEISAISRGLKAVARELNIPVIALAQLSRAVESRPNKRPMLSDLRESGSIEQDADLVMFIYRDEYYYPASEQAGMAEVIVGKQRNGPIGTITLTYLNSHTRFANVPSAAEQQAARLFSGN